MDSLPPKPESTPPPLRDRDDKAYSDTRRHARPMAHQHRYRPPDVYMPRQRSDTYFASTSRRDERDRDSERDRSWRHRDRDYRDSDRYEVRRSNDRFRPRRDDDRYFARQRYSPERHDSRPSSPRRRGGSPYSRRSRSRSPYRQRPASPGSSYRGRHPSRSRSISPRPRSPSQKHRRHSIRSPSPLSPVHNTRSEARSPKPEQLSPPSPAPKEEAPSNVAGNYEIQIPIEIKSDTVTSPPCDEHQNKNILTSTPISEQTNHEQISNDMDTESFSQTGHSKEELNKSEMHIQPPSLPEQTRLSTGPALHGDNTPRQRTSRSPPRGPRNHPRTAPYQPPAYPTGPRAGRQMDGKLPRIPEYKGRSLQEIDPEVTQLEAHRAHLASEYMQHALATRRALHELDMSTIDLRAAESRRKIADNQLEKAKNGILGIDAVPIDTSDI